MRNDNCFHKRFDGLNSVSFLVFSFATKDLFESCLVGLVLFSNGFLQLIRKECLAHPWRVSHHFLGVLPTVFVPDVQFFESDSFWALNATSARCSIGVGWIPMFYAPRILRANLLELALEFDECAI